MKLFSTLAIGMCFLTSSSFAYTLSLEASNNTDQDVKVAGSASYEQTNQPMVWQVPVPAMNSIIAQHGKDIPMNTLTQLTTYNIEYFDFSDMNGKLLVSCLDDYFPVDETAVLRFTLYKVPGQNKLYHCQRQVIKQPNRGDANV